ncbi:uncharacterized protein [Montipora capricornis]|uniref:uncharacterized protein n=1 Tax=Montipora capricornis TaxID=246305 RepID=UPI0035F10FDE
MGFSRLFIFALVANCFSSPVRSGDEKGDSILPHRLFIEDENFLNDEDGRRESPDLSTLEEISETEDIPDENNLKEKESLDKDRDQDSLPEADTPTIEVLHNHLNVRNGEKTQEDAKPVATEKEDLDLAREDGVHIHIPVNQIVSDAREGDAGIHIPVNQIVSDATEDGARIHIPVNQIVSDAREGDAGIHIPVNQIVSDATEDGARIHIPVNQIVSDAREDGAGIPISVNQIVSDATEDGARIPIPGNQIVSDARESGVGIRIGEFVEAKRVGKASQLHTNAKKVEDSFGGAVHIETNQPVEKEDGASLETSERAADDSKMAAPFQDDGGSGDF